MSLVHCGVEVWVALLDVGALEADDVVEDADELDGADVVGEPVELVEVAGVLDALGPPDPDVELVQPTSAAVAMSAKTGSSARHRIICVPLSRNPLDVVADTVKEA